MIPGEYRIPGFPEFRISPFPCPTCGDGPMVIEPPLDEVEEPQSAAWITARILRGEVAGEWLYCAACHVLLHGLDIDAIFEQLARRTGLGL